jgi:RND family efflux transporter MFP subunit
MSGRFKRAAVLQVVAMTAALLAAGCEDDANVYQPPPPPKVTVATPEVRVEPEYLEFTGNTVALETVKLVARVEGYLDKLHFEDGQRVRKGDLLFTIQRNTYEAQLQQARSRILAAKSRLQYAETELARFSNLFRLKAAAASQVDQWRNERDSAQAELLAAQADEELASLNLGYTSVRAPFDGRMGRHLVDPGNLVGAGGEKTVLAEINRIHPIYVYFSINERDLLRVRDRNKGRDKPGEQPRGRPLSMGLADEPGFPRDGELDFTAITVDPGTGTLQVRGIFPNPDLQIIPGLFARVRGEVGQPREVMLVPTEAVGFDQQGNYVLTVGDKNIVDRKGVTIGQQIGEQRVITSGLAGSERVIVNGLLRAIPGREVVPETAGTVPASPKPAG